jgi:uncharacterized glyoxalase superfamily metalloenzyme YdcJ
MEFGYVQVNIYNKNRILIPLLGRRDAVIKNLGIGANLYKKLKQVPGIEIYTVQEDAQRIKNLQAQQAVANVAVESNITLEAKIEVQEEVQVFEVQEEIKAELTVEGHAEVTVIDEVQIIEEVIDEQPIIEEVQLQQENLDALIEEKLEELPEEEVEDIILTQEDFEEIAEQNSIKKYEKSVLEGMTKAQLKEILNVERGFEPGHKYYGGYHDTQSTLVGYVLNSQK